MNGGEGMIVNRFPRHRRSAGFEATMLNPLIAGSIATSPKNRQCLPIRGGTVSAIFLP